MINLKDNNKWNLNKPAHFLQFHTISRNVFVHFNAIGFQIFNFYMKIKSFHHVL